MFLLPQRQSIGEILGEGLADVAKHWSENRRSRKAMQALGFSDNEARAYAHLGPQAQMQAIQARQQQQAQEKSSAAINSILNEGMGGAQPYAPNYQQPSTQPMATGMQKRSAPEQQQEAIQQATGIAQNPAYRKLQEQQQAAQAQQQQQLAQRQGPQANQPTAEQQAILQAQAQQGQRESSPKDRLEDIGRRRRALAAAPLSSKEKIDAHQLLQSQENAIRQEMKEAQRAKTESEKVADKKQARTDKETLPYYTETKKRAEKADEMINRIDQYEAILDTGEVNTNGFFALMEELGEVKGYVIGDVIGGFARAVSKAGTTTETQVVKKLAADFMTGFKDATGASNIPVQEMQLFMERVPGLMQSVEGQRAILRTFRAMAGKDLATDKTMDAIIARNGDERPKHLQSKVSSEMKDYKSELRKELNASIRLVGAEKQKAKAERAVISAEARANLSRGISNLIPRIGK